MAAAELKQRLGEDYKPGLFVGTIHSLANYFLTSTGIKTEKILDNEEFDKLFAMVKKYPQCIKHLEWILLDEAQDSDPLQFEFLFDMINPDNFFICGDTKQSIYQFNGSEPELLLELTERPGVHSYDLNENYRNGENILNYAKRLIRPTG
jgi:superfamily I DNA/RNA helicase